MNNFSQVGVRVVLFMVMILFLGGCGAYGGGLATQAAMQIGSALAGSAVNEFTGGTQPRTTVATTTQECFDNDKGGKTCVTRQTYEQPTSQQLNPIAMILGAGRSRDTHIAESQTSNVSPSKQQARPVNAIEDDIPGCRRRGTC